MSSNVLVIGSGGREHAIVWKLSQSIHVKNIFTAPGSHAIEQVAKCTRVNLDLKKFQEIGKWCKSKNVDLVVIGPEDPLALGFSDVLIAEGIKVFGPQKHGAKIESDKSWAKTFMDKYSIPTARWRAFNNAVDAKDFINNSPFPALVVKASGLAAGKGVVVAENKVEACAAVDEILTDKKFGAAGETVVVEELLEGEEVSILAFCDGTTVRAMLPAQDHKRIYDGDRGLNTGGMGAYCPCPLLSSSILSFVQESILQKTVNGLRKEDVKYIGVLYAGLMLTQQGPKVLEFNCRFGDPETEVILPLLETDLFSVMKACCDGTLHLEKITWKSGVSAVGVVMASKGYPETSSKGQVIEGLETIQTTPGQYVFHCGTEFKDHNFITNGGRVLIAVSLAPQLAVAAAKATQACSTIDFEGQQHRKDIAHKGIARSILQSGKLTYKASGVDISAGDSLVSQIKSEAKSTVRPGVLGSLGGFGGLFDLQAAGFVDPLLVSGTDGVGTKLKIAQEMGIHDTIGIDLVAMCVNDVLAHGAEPLFFLDYFACGALDVEVARKVVSGIAEGCRQAGCSLIGGETAEMPDMYPPGEYDVAGFAVGAVERTNLLPTTDLIKSDDVVIGLLSSGVHSNGFSLVRKVMKVAGARLTDVASFSKNGRSYGEELSTPTKIYVKTVVPAINSGKIKAFAHITGGGLLENIPRILPMTLAVKLDASSWPVPPVFGWLAAIGSISADELLRTFNCGIGAVLIVDKEAASEILEITSGFVIGRVVVNEDSKQVIVDNFDAAMDSVMRPFIPDVVALHSAPKKRVAVLISGSGTNLQALIDEKRSSTEIVLVISNKGGVEGLKRAERAKIPTKVVSHSDYASRVEFDRAMHAELVAARVELVCLAGFMRILSGEFTALWRGRLINVHPSLLPAFKGTHAQRQALEAGVTVTGCTVHFVAEDVDAGAIITQEVVSVEPGDTEELLIEKIKTQAEHKAYPRALELIASGKVRLGDNNKIVRS